MPCQYARDDAHKICRLTLTEPLALNDVTVALDRQVEDGAWDYATIVDARRAVLALAPSQNLFEHVDELAAIHGAPGPVALVTRDGVGPTHLFSVKSTTAGRAFQVFWDIDEAEHWLIVRLARGW